MPKGPGWRPVTAPNGGVWSHAFTCMSMHTCRNNSPSNTPPQPSVTHALLMCHAVMQCQVGENSRRVASELQVKNTSHQLQ